jgi:hypothetical protein
MAIEFTTSDVRIVIFIGIFGLTECIFVIEIIFCPLASTRRQKRQKTACVFTTHFINMQHKADVVAVKELCKRGVREDGAQIFRNSESKG